MGQQTIALAKRPHIVVSVYFSGMIIVLTFLNLQKERLACWCEIGAQLKELIFENASVLISEERKSDVMSFPCLWKSFKYITVPCLSFKLLNYSAVFL